MAVALKTALILVAIYTIMALLAGWFHGAYFATWPDASSFFYAGELLGAVLMLAALLCGGRWRF